MGKLKEKIIEFSNENASNIYCKGVVHIHFNAWSYMDSNLWASIVTKIFEELNEYISNNSKTQQTKIEIEKQLTNQLSITKEEIGILENKKNAVSEQISSLEDKRKSISDELDRKIEKVKTDTLWNMVDKANQEFDAKEKIIAALKENDTYLETEEDLKRIVPEVYWDNPEKTYQLVKSKYAFLTEFFRKDQIKTNLIWLIAILLVIIFAPPLLGLFFLQIGKTNFIIPQASLSVLIAGGAAFKRAETVYKRLQPLIASFWNVKEAHEKQIKEAVSKFEQEDKALKLEIEKGKAEVLLISEHIQKAESIKTDLEFRINNAFATEALYSFIDRRSKSEDYKKHLGIISIIRKDFEILNDLFTDHNHETEKIINAAEFKLKFKKPLERIILYIDDLDRCPEDNVVQVLEAVNLLMAFPLFIVVVGVDSRWVKNALIKKHALQFTAELDHTEKNGLEIIEPANYLEKIFQVPFHLKDAKDISVKDMIKKLSEDKGLTKDDPGAIKNDEEENTIPSLNDTAEEVADANHPSDRMSGGLAGGIPIDSIENLILGEKEIRLMQDMSEIIGSNPRAVKRFVNIYRILKAHEEFVYDVSAESQELMVILFLLALPLGSYRKLLSSFELFIEDTNNTKQLSVYLHSNTKISGLDELKDQLKGTLSGKNFKNLQSATVSLLKEHNEFIRRFTFMQI